MAREAPSLNDIANIRPFNAIRESPTPPWSDGQTGRKDQAEADSHALKISVLKKCKPASFGRVIWQQSPGWTGALKVHVEHDASPARFVV